MPLPLDEPRSSQLPHARPHVSARVLQAARAVWKRAAQRRECRAGVRAELLQTPFAVGDAPLPFRRDEILLTTEGHVILSGSPELRRHRVHRTTARPRPLIFIPFPQGQTAARAAPVCEVPGPGLLDAPVRADACLSSSATATASRTRAPAAVTSSGGAVQAASPFRIMLGVTVDALEGADGRPLAVPQRMHWEPGDVVLAECTPLPLGVDGEPLPRERWGAVLTGLVQAWKGPFLLPESADRPGSRRPAVCRPMDVIEAPSIVLRGLGARLRAALLLDASPAGDSAGEGTTSRTGTQPPLLAWEGAGGGVHVRGRGSAQGTASTGPAGLCSAVALAEPATGCGTPGKGVFNGGVLVAWRGACSFAAMQKNAALAGAAALVIVDQVGLEAHAEHLVGGSAADRAAGRLKARRAHACRADRRGDAAVPAPPLLVQHGPQRLPTVLVPADVGCAIAGTATATATAPLATVLMHRAQCQAAVGTCDAAGQPWPWVGSASASGHRPEDGRLEALELCLHLRSVPSGA